jgi:hypothetical protein
MILKILKDFRAGTYNSFAGNVLTADDTFEIEI